MVIVGNQETPISLLRREKMTKKYVYVFIRKDLPNPQKIVQASHAVLEISRNYLRKWEEHPSVLVVGVNSEHQLKKFSKKVQDKGFRVIEFFEPLFENQMTSFAVEPVLEEEKINFRCFNLIRESAFTSKTVEENYVKPLKSIVNISKCQHLEYKVDYVETFAYEFTPRRICKRCGEHLKQEPTEQEKVDLYKDFWWELEPCDKEIKEKKNGFNI